MAVGCGCGLMAAPGRSQTPLVFFADPALGGVMRDVRLMAVAVAAVV